MSTTPKVIGAHMWNFKPNFKCLPLKFWGDPRASLWCALASLGQSLACVKISGACTPRGRNIVSRKSQFWVDPNSRVLLFGGGPKFTWFVSLNARGIVLDHISFQFWISCFIPEIFAIKVGCCVKLCQILHVFGPKIFLGEAPRIFGLALYADIDHVAKFCGDRTREFGDPMAN